MEALDEKILNTERRDAQNLMLLLDSEHQFSVTGYKVMQSQEKNGFVKCRRLTQNGCPKLFYDIAPYQCLERLLGELKPEEFLTVLSSLAELLLKVRENGFMRCEHIPLDFEHVFVKQDSLKVFFLYLPLEGAQLPGTGEKQLGRLKTEIEQAYSRFPALFNESGRTFWEVLNQSVHTLEELKQVLELAALPPKQSALEADGENPYQKFFPSLGDMPPNSSRLEQGEQPQAVLRKEAAGDSGKKRGLFSRMFRKGEKTSAPLETPEAEGGATELLTDAENRTERLKLVSVNAPDKVQLVVADPEYRIGKKKELVQGLIGWNQAVSRLHCKIVLKNGRHYVVDLGSANGTFVNNRRIDANREVPLQSGDRLRLANSEFLVQAV